MLPGSIPTRETSAFIAGAVRRGGRVIEIGCGDGAVAAELVRLGFTVTGLDADPELVARARDRGVDAHEARWPEYSAEPVDAIAFTRSLHHIAPLDAAVARASELLAPGGVLLIEDFAFDEADAGTIRWFVGVLRSPEARTLLVDRPDELVSQLLRAEDARSAWRRNHDHDLHDMPTMTRAVARVFATHDLQAVPYLYRYLVPVLPESERAAAFVEAFLREEAALARQGRIVPIGRRVIARLAANPQVSGGAPK